MCLTLNLIIPLGMDNEISNEVSGINFGTNCFKTVRN